MSRLKLIGVALVAALSATGALAQGKTWTNVKIATEGAYAPWNFSGPGGKLDGFEIDLAKDLCARMKVTCEIVAQDWDGIIPALNAGKYDVIMAGMNITDKRKEVVQFSRSYGGEPATFGVEKSSPLDKMPGMGERFDLTKDEPAAQKAIDAIKPLLKGKTIGVQVSTIHANFLDKYLKDTVEIREYKTTEQHDLDLLAGRLDAVFAGGSPLRATFAKPRLQGLRDGGPALLWRGVRQRRGGGLSQDRSRAEGHVRHRDHGGARRRHAEDAVAEVVHGRHLTAELGRADDRPPSSPSKRGEVESAKPTG